jgi:hypothetical protein
MGILGCRGRRTSKDRDRYNDTVNPLNHLNLPLPRPRAQLYNAFCN